MTTILYKSYNFIDLKEIVFFTIFIIFIILLGTFLKNFIGILSFLIFLILLLSNKKDNLVLFLIIWIYIYNFYIGQGWVTNYFINKYLIKGQLYIVITFFYFFKRNWIKTIFNRKIFNWAIIFILISFISDILHFSFTFNFINQAYFIFLFFIIINLPKKNNFEKNLINLLIAIGLIELIISYLQVNQFIPPPIKNMKTITGQTFLWRAGLDDAASGTFGAGASNQTSWFETLMMLFFFSYGYLKKNKNIIIFSLIFLLHYTMVDSKTALGVTLFSIIFLIYRLKIIKITKLRNVFILIIIVLFSFITLDLIKGYYTTKVSGSPDRTLKLVLKSYELVVDRFWEWGKIAGFKYISDDYMQNNPVYFLIGYGRNNYTYDKKMGEIESMDTPLMKFNNITRSRSSLITIYGQLGIPGLLMLLYLFKILWGNIKYQRFRSLFGKSFQYSGISFLFGSFIFMFLYAGHNIKDLAFLSFFVFYALAIRFDKKGSPKLGIQLYANE